MNSYGTTPPDSDRQLSKRSDRKRGKKGMNSARVPSHMQRLATFGDGSNSKGSGRKRYQDL